MAGATTELGKEVVMDPALVISIIAIIIVAAIALRVFGKKS